MNARNRNNITLSHIAALIKKIEDEVAQYQRTHDHSSFLSRLIHKHPIKRLQHDLANLYSHVQETSKAGVSISAFYTYAYVLNKICGLIKQEGINEALIHIIKKHLIAELKNNEETEWDESLDENAQIEKSMTILLEVTHFDSKKHWDFCREWRVSGPIDGYPHWNEFIKTIYSEKSELDAGNYTKIVSLLKTKFDLKETKTSMWDKEDKNYSQFQFGMDMQTVLDTNRKVKYHLSELKEEMEMWSEANILKIFLQYMLSFLEKEGMIAFEKKQMLINKEVLIPLIHHFLNPVRKGLDFTEYNANALSDLFLLKTNEMKAAYITQKDPVLETSPATHLDMPPHYAESNISRSGLFAERSRFKSNVQPGSEREDQHSFSHQRKVI